MARCGTWDGRTCCRWEVGGGEGERERESSGTQSQWPGGACKERQGNNAAASGRPLPLHQAPTSKQSLA
jgi:hypothetical protein